MDERKATEFVIQSASQALNPHRILQSRVTSTHELLHGKSNTIMSQPPLYTLLTLVLAAFIVI
jgi:hypothetical protein